MSGMPWSIGIDSFSGDVTASDASSVGAGVVVACGLIAAGVAAAVLCKSDASSGSGCRATWGEGWPTCGQSLARAAGEARLADIPTIPASPDSSPGGLSSCGGEGWPTCGQSLGPVDGEVRLADVPTIPASSDSTLPGHPQQRCFRGEGLALWTIPADWAEKRWAGDVACPYLVGRW